MPVDTQRAFSSPRLVKLFNEWMRRFTEEPEKFVADFRTAGQFLQEQAAGKDPSYGETCAEYLARLEDEMDAPAAAADPGVQTLQIKVIADTANARRKLKSLAKMTKRLKLKRKGAGVSRRGGKR